MPFSSLSRFHSPRSSAPALLVGLMAALTLMVTFPIGAHAGEVPAVAPTDGSMSDSLKKAATHGTNTAVDEAVRGATVGDATKKGTAAAVNHALGMPGAPAVPQAAPAAPEDAH